MDFELSARDQAIIASALAAAIRRDARRQRSQIADVRALDDAMRSHVRRQWAETAAFAGGDRRLDRPAPPH
jgi:hypothetical protein